MTLEETVSREKIEKIVGAEFVDLQDGTEEWRDYVNDTCLSILEKVHNLPSVKPTRPHGKWIEVDVCNCHARLKCSVCDRVIEPVFTFGEYSYEDIKEFYPFCHCGADMREVDADA